MGFLLLMMLGVGVAASLLMSSEDDDGATADENSPSEEPEDRNIVLEAGAQNPSGGAGNDKFTGIVEGTVRGAAGNDTFSFENGYAANIYGGIQFGARPGMIRSASKMGMPRTSTAAYSSGRGRE